MGRPRSVVKDGDGVEKGQIFFHKAFGRMAGRKVRKVFVIRILEKDVLFSVLIQDGLVADITVRREVY